jgi:polyhydroxyalkanoate synthesis regulator phasin
MRKTIAAASIAVGGLGVLGLGAATIAGAQDEAPDTTAEDEAPAEGGGWVQDALDGLVEDGTITQEQADAVAGAPDDAHPAHGFGPWHHGFGLGFGAGPDVLAESLGIDEEALHDALRDGRTIAEVAEEQGVDVQDVVDAIVAAHQERLDEAVADGDLTQEDADELMAGAEERATAFVNGEPPDLEDLPDLGELGEVHPFGDGEGHGGWRGHGPWGDHGADDEGTTDGDTSDEGTTEGSSHDSSGDAEATTA